MCKKGRWLLTIAFCILYVCIVDANQQVIDLQDVCMMIFFKETLLWVFPRKRQRDELF